VPPAHPPTQADSDEQRIADLVVASRILVQEGVLDSFGHVTVRSLKNRNHYFMPRAMPPALVTTKDIVELDLDSVPVDRCGDCRPLRGQDLGPRSASRPIRRSAVTTE
jgi:hypothetical protein